jgi:hypothetical protein
MPRLNFGVHASWQKLAGELLLGEVYAVRFDDRQLSRAAVPLEEWLLLRHRYMVVVSRLLDQ